MSPSPSLESLPFDILFQIAAYLDVRDYIHISHSSHSMFSSMKNTIIARATVKNTMLHSKEGQAAWAGEIGHYQAIQHRFDIHEAVATASPYSVSVLAYATDFLYHQGFLCYRFKNQIRLLNVHGAGQKERVLDLDHVVRRIIGIGNVLSDLGEQITLLRFSSGILILLVNQTNSNEGILIAIDLQSHPGQARRRRLLLQEPVSSSDPILFVRHTRLYIWCGTFTLANGQEVAWQVWGTDFRTLQRTEFPVERAVDGELDKTICFEVYQGHLYMVSIIDDRESSFYHWSCYAPNRGSKKGNGRLWRRDHREGPIHEMWADLSIQVDEKNGLPVILECRREWLDGGSENHRTYYTTPLPTPDEALAMQPAEGLTHQGGLVDSDDEHRESTEKRQARDCHAEHETSDPLDQRFDFIPAYTRYSSYHLAAATYIDLVNDPKSQADGVHFQHCLRLRTKSRNRDRSDEKGVRRYRSPLSDAGQSQTDGPSEGVSEGYFHAHGVYLWPPVNAPSRLLDLLCPDKSTSLVRAVCDERSLIYSTSAEGLPLHHRMLVLISFDPMIRLPYLTSLCNHKASTNSIRKVLDAPRPGFQFSRPLVHNADAFHLAIRQGYRP
ncbi:unnamed protein product [Penicillium salamii]|nr:unnamed protein product [Penicillium salamii]CAG8222307.1 unnamed protein product [Penicillium salamii]CAG8392856.1 unnamed protein product [Penicillium salamii]CAG8417925.1 unnamed protein product [Penicillium salamii]CAG8899332.1 unnamed protein product [Penicillium salamii]